MTLKVQRCQHLITSLLLEMPPGIKRTVSPTLLSAELLPLLADIIMPSFRPVSAEEMEHEGENWGGGA